MAKAASVYCIDTSALIDLPLHYPPKSFRDTWTALEELAKAGRLVAPREVRRELHVKDDDAYKWVRRQAAFVLPTTVEQQRLVKEIQAKFPGWVDPTARWPIADPFVVALAASLKPPAIVVTHERPGGPGAAKIPNACRDYKLESIVLADVFVREGWRFSRA